MSRVCEAILAYLLLIQQNVGISSPIEADEGEDVDKKSASSASELSTASKPVCIFPMAILSPTFSYALCAQAMIKAELAERALGRASAQELLLSSASQDAQDNSSAAVVSEALDVSNVHRLVVFLPGRKWNVFEFPVDLLDGADDSVTYVHCLQQHLGQWLLQVLMPMQQVPVPLNTITRPVDSLAPMKCTTFYKETYTSPSAVELWEKRSPYAGLASSFQLKTLQASPLLGGGTG